MAIYKLNDDQGNEYDIGALAENVKITLEDGSETTLAEALGSSSGLGALGDKIVSLEDSITDLETNTTSLADQVEDLETNTTSLAERVEVLEEKPLNGKQIIFYGDDFTSAYRGKIADAVGSTCVDNAAAEGVGYSLIQLEALLRVSFSKYDGYNSIRIVSCGFDDFFNAEEIRLKDYSLMEMGTYSNIVAGPKTYSNIYEYLDRICYLLMGAGNNSTFSSNHFSKTYWILPHRMFADGDYGTLQKNITWEDYRNAIKRVCGKWGIEVIDLQEVVPPVAGGLTQNAQFYANAYVSSNKYALIQLKEEFYTNLIIPYIVKRIS